MTNPRLSLTCILCADWKQSQPHCAHGLDNGENGGSLWFTPASVLTIEIGVRASKALSEENLVGTGHRSEIIERRFGRAA